MTQIPPPSASIHTQPGPPGVEVGGRSRVCGAGWNSLLGAALVAGVMLFPTPDAAQTTEPCVGDCNGNLEVTVEELVTGVNLALGDELPAPCAAFDRSGDGRVTIDELVEAVANALSDCGTAPPDTATPEPSATPSAAAEATPTPTLFVISLGRAYALNELDGTVSVISTAVRPSVRRGAGTAVGVIPVEGVPRDIALSPAGRVAYVTTRSPDALALVDILAMNTLGAIPGVGRDPEAVACLPNGEAVYVTNVGDGTVSVIDTGMKQVLKVIQVGEAPNDIAITPDGTCAYVTNSSEQGTVSAIDTAQNAVIGNIGVGEFPSAVAVTPDGRHAYVTNFLSSTVSVIETGSNRVVSTLFIDVLEDESLPTSIAFSPDGARAYVTNFGSDAVLVIDTAKALTDPPRAVMLSMTTFVDPFPSSIEIGPASDIALVTNFVRDRDGFPSAGTVATIDTTTSRITERITVGRFPLRLALAQPPAGASGTPTDTPTAGPPTITPTPRPNCGAVSCPPGSLCHIDVNCHQLGGDCTALDRCLPVME